MPARLIFSRMALRINFERSVSSCLTAWSMTGDRISGTQTVTNLHSAFLTPRFIIGVYTEYITRLQDFFSDIFFTDVIYTYMPGQRSPGQKLIPIPMNEEFIELLDAAVVKSDYSDRSKFIRDAIVEKLQALGYKIPPGVSAAPTKIGKGGARIKYPAGRHGRTVLNEKHVNSKQPSDAAKILRRAAGEDKHPSK